MEQKVGRIGIDVGGTGCKIGLVDRNNGTVIVQDGFSTKQMAAEEIVANMAKMAKHFQGEADKLKLHVSGIGVGFPGVVDKENGKVIYSNNIVASDLDVAGPIEHATKLKVNIDNDANATALGEAIWGAAKDYSSSVTVTLGTGFGSGVVKDKKIIMEAEFGHTLLQKNGEDCNCGRKGCLETYVSATALIKFAKRGMMQDKRTLLWEQCNGKIELVDAKMVFDCANIGDALSKKIVDDYINNLGEGLTDMANSYAPDAIILGGGVSKAGDTLIKPVQQFVNDNTFGRKKVAIKQAQFYNGIVGAASLVEDSIDKQ